MIGATLGNKMTTVKTPRSWSNCWMELCTKGTRWGMGGRAVGALGKVRHLAVAVLWCQQRALRGDIHYSKIAGKANPSDMMTKGLGAVDIIRYMAEIGFIPLAGRSAIAPKARNG